MFPSLSFFSYIEGVGDRVSFYFNTDWRPSAPLVTGNGLRQLADHFCDESKEAGVTWFSLLFTPQPNGPPSIAKPCRILREDPGRVRRKDVVFVKVDYLEMYLRDIAPLVRERHVVVAHNGDKSFGYEHLQLLRSDGARSVGALFVQNIAIGVYHERLFALPIGLENMMYRAGGCFRSYALAPRLQSFGVSLVDAAEQNNPRSAVSLGSRIRSLIRASPKASVGANDGGALTLGSPLVLAAFSLGTNPRERAWCYANLRLLNSRHAVPGQSQSPVATLGTGPLGEFAELLAGAESLAASRADGPSHPFPTLERLSKWTDEADDDDKPTVVTAPPTDPGDHQVTSAAPLPDSFFAELKTATDECPFNGNADSRAIIYDNFRKMLSHPFVASPPGNGLQSHRTWEALFAGSVPIVLSSSFQRRTMTNSLEGSGVAPDKRSSSAALPLLPAEVAGTLRSSVQQGLTKTSFELESADPSLVLPRTPSALDDDLYSGLPVLLIRDWTGGDLSVETLLGSAARLSRVADNTRMWQMCLRAIRRHRASFASRNSAPTASAETTSLLDACARRGMAAPCAEQSAVGHCYGFPDSPPPLVDPHLLALAPEHLTAEQRTHLREAIFALDRLQLSHWYLEVDRQREERC